jgi:uncharacterized protein YbbC (DUF1343 family)
MNGENHIGAKLTVVKMKNWQRGLWFDQTGVPWVDPSPNLKTLTAAALYPGTAFAEFTSLSVGRGTDAPFEQVGASWIASDAEATLLADTLNKRKITGVTFAPVTFTPTGSYPYAGKQVHGLRMTVTDRQRLNAPAMGVELLSAINARYPSQLHLENTGRLVLHEQTIKSLLAGTDPATIAESWEEDLTHFRERRIQCFLYSYLPEE